ncbi:DUF6247 family protein [Streptosporangium sp. NPDC001559]|uniref:DUF6247 family protein n=1 Tax=Streptosporangium sp. NPDC001559 TaxID=3366187 RepID=UPI0036EAFD03
MSAQPVEEDPQDPQVILRDLPARERTEFLRQYRAAAEAARDDVARYKDLNRLLYRWHLVVIATTRPGYYEAIQQAKTGPGVPLMEALEAEVARRR